MTHAGPYLVESQVPIPKGRRPNSRPWMYPFHTMAVGDSFALPDLDAAFRARSAASTYGKAHGMKFSARGLRLWRIA